MKEGKGLGKEQVPAMPLLSKEGEVQVEEGKRGQIDKGKEKKQTDTGQ